MSRGGGRSPRSGFTLLEVMVAVAIIGGALMGMASFLQKFTHANGMASIGSSASDLATERLETVRGQTNYAALDTLARLESTILGYPGFTRQTYVQRTLSATADYRTVTVVVTHPALTLPLRKTTVIASY